MDIPESPALTTRQAAAYLRMHVSTFRTHVQAGEIARTGTPGKHLFLPADLDDWFRRNRVPSAAERDAARFTGRQAATGNRPSQERVNELLGRKTTQRPSGAPAAQQQQQAGGR